MSNSSVQRSANSLLEDVVVLEVASAVEMVFVAVASPAPLLVPVVAVVPVDTLPTLLPVVLAATGLVVPVGLEVPEPPDVLPAAVLAPLLERVVPVAPAMLELEVSAVMLVAVCPESARFVALAEVGPPELAPSELADCAASPLLEQPNPHDATTASAPGPQPNHGTQVRTLDIDHRWLFMSLPRVIVDLDPVVLDAGGRGGVIDGARPTRRG